MSEQGEHPAPGRGPEQAASEEGASAAVGWVVAALVLAAGLGLALLGQDVPAPVGRGAAAPGFTVPSLDAKPLSLAQQRGRVVLLNFWATWCRPCEEEMPAMERLYQALQPEGFELLAISVDENAEDVRKFRERMAISFPIGLDPKQEVARSYQTAGFPESLLIDASGRIVERYVGPRAWDDPLYVARVRGLIAEAR